MLSLSNLVPGLSELQIQQLFVNLDAAAKKGSPEEPPENLVTRKALDWVLKDHEKISRLLQQVPPSDEDHSCLVIIFHHCVCSFPEGSLQVLNHVKRIPALNLQKFINAKSYLKLTLKFLKPADDRTLYPMEGTALYHIIAKAGGQNIQTFKKYIKIYLQHGLDFDARHACGLTARQISHLRYDTIYKIYDEIDEESKRELAG